MDQEKRIFSQDSIFKLTGARNKEEALEKLKSLESNLEDIIKKYDGDFSQDLLWEEHLDELATLLKNILEKAKNKSKHEEFWFGLRLLQEDSKRCIIIEILKNYCQISEYLFWI